MPLFLLCQDIQRSVVHLVGLHGQRHCHGTNWPHWSDTECFVSSVSQVPTCASQNKLSCNVAGQKNVEGACWGPAPPERKQMFHSRNVLWFWMPSQRRHQRHGGELKTWSVIVCTFSRGHSRWDHRCKTWSFSTQPKMSFYLFSKWFHPTVDLLHFDSSLLFSDILLQK